MPPPPPHKLINIIDDNFSLIHLSLTRSFNLFISSLQKLCCARQPIPIDQSATANIELFLGQCYIERQNSIICKRILQVRIIIKMSYYWRIHGQNCVWLCCVRRSLSATNGFTTSVSSSQPKQNAVIFVQVIYCIATNCDILHIVKCR